MSELRLWDLPHKAYNKLMVTSNPHCKPDNFPLLIIDQSTNPGARADDWLTSSAPEE